MTKQVRELLAGFMDEAPLGVSVLDLDREFLYVNDAMASLHGVSLGAHLGRTLDEVLPAVAPAISAALSAALESGASTPALAVDGPSPFDAAEGHWLMWIAPWRGDDGAIAGATVVARDVTAERRSQELEDRRHQLERELSRALQGATLTQLPQQDDLELQARYRPAAAEAAIGGDWYDAVLDADGATSIVVGDVTGHDSSAAAAMAQVRGVLRAYLWDRCEPPSATVSRLDAAVAGLHLDLLATLVCGRIETVLGGGRRLSWTNAGHPPPLLQLPDGTVTVLDGVPELLIGVDRSAARSHRSVALPAGSTVLLYTDGLIERRGRSLDDGMERLRDAAAWQAQLPLAGLLDRLLVEVGERSDDDDIALLGVRVGNPG